MRWFAPHQLLEQAMLAYYEVPVLWQTQICFLRYQKKHSKSFLYSHLQEVTKKNIPKVTAARLPFRQTLHNLGSLTNEGRDVEVVLVVLLVRWGGS